MNQHKKLLQIDFIHLIDLIIPKYFPFLKLADGLLFTCLQ